MRRPRSEAGKSLADQLVASIGTRVPNPPAVVDYPVAATGTIEVRERPGGKVLASARVTPEQTSAEIARDLAAQIGSAEQLDGARKAPPLFQSANLGPEVGEDFNRIVETLYAADAFKDYDDLERNLEIGDQRGDRATLREALDKAEARARRAHKLFMGAKLELVKWELDARKVEAAMRQKATEVLKNDPERTKRVTNDDVEAQMVESFPDEVASQEIKRAKLKGVTESLEHLTRRWDMKCGDIRTLLETLR